MEGFAEFTPYFGPTNEVDAGSVWRVQKLKEFEFKVRSLGLEDEPEVQALLYQMRADTVQLEELAERHKQEGPSHWWQDGEYDDARAEEQNDLGTECFKAKKYKEAFEHYTDAIRLAPSKGVYHSNRAAAGLKLGRNKVAAQDGEAAMQRSESSNTKAHFRAARAHLLSNNPERAVEIYRSYLEMDGGSKDAEEGLREAETAASLKAAAEAQEAASARAGERPGLALEPLNETQAAQLLLSAEEMLQANPYNQACLCARIEGLIHCRRYEEAEEACSNLIEGSVDGLYLRAEVEWRAFQLDAAQETLASALVLCGESSKCLQLRSRVEGMRVRLAKAQECRERGNLRDAVEEYTLLLTADPSQSTRFTACVLQARAGVHQERDPFSPEALQDLNQALKLEPAHLSSLISRATLYKDLGKLEECFLDLRKAQQVSPETPGLWGGLIDAAKRCMRQRQGNTENMINDSLNEAEYYKLLGIPANATAKEVTRAYRKMAAKWHPDKWNTASEKRKGIAESMFKKVSEAYEVLNDPDKRIVYNEQSQK